MKNIPYVPKHLSESRAEYLLRVAAEYIDKYCPEEEIKFDEAVCDGACLAEDCIMEALNLRDIRLPNDLNAKNRELYKGVRAEKIKLRQIMSKDSGKYYVKKEMLEKELKKLL